MAYCSATNPSLICLCFLLIILLGHGGVEVEASHKVFKHLQTTESLAVSSASQPYRTSYHFQPPKNWINDPNGPMYYKGLYHLFYQYNPKGAVWGNIVWAHSTSTDLVNWIPHEPAIYPSQTADINGCWSGSATILRDGTPAILYTGINPQNQQVQNIAFPKNASDPYLIKWVKSSANPLMAPTTTNMINASSFRDPTTAWQGPDGRWRVIIGNKRGKTGRAILYRSKDFIHWIKAQHPLHSAPKTGMWECPDFYPVSSYAPVGLDTSVAGPHVKHVLKVSLDDTRREYYTIGTYNISKDKYTPDAGSVEGDLGLRYDYGKFYASKTFFDYAKNRRILWGWINESSSTEDDIKKGWSGIQAVPRAIWLDKSGKQLVQWPIKELEKLRTGPVDVPTKLIKGGSKFEVSGLTAAQADVELAFNVKSLDKAEQFDPSWVKAEDLCTKRTASIKGGVGPFGIMALASKGLDEYTAIYFRIFKASKNNKYVVAMCSDQTRSSLNNSTDKANYGAYLNIDPTKEKLSLRTLIDRSIVESFGGEGKGCITARVYPTKAIEDGAHLYAFNYGATDVTLSSFTAWSMNKAQIN